MNDASPICWRWLEGRCNVLHCKYAHTFRRHHASQRSSGDGRSSFSKARSSCEGRRRSFQPGLDFRRSGDRRRSSASSPSLPPAPDANRLDGPALPIRPVPARKSMERARAFSDAATRPWVAMARASGSGDVKLTAGVSGNGSATGSSGSGDENVNGKSAGNKSFCSAVCNGAKPAARPAVRAGKAAALPTRVGMVDGEK
jgi:hypothetical protein